MSTISFNVVAHDLASRVFRGVGNAAMAMAAKIRAADAMAGRTDGVDRNSRAWNRFRVAAERATPAVQKLNEGLRRLTGDNIRGQGRMWFRLALAGIALAPAVIGPAVYALGALEGAIVAVTPGAVSLGLAMMGVYKRIEKVAAGTRQATGPLAVAAAALKRLGVTYQHFLNSTQNKVSDVFTQAFRGARDLLPKLIPMTNRFATVLSTFLHGVRREMQSPAFDKALQWMKHVGSLTFKNVLHSGENLTKFFYNLARSFEKAGVDIKGGWLRTLTRNMNDWAKGLGDSPGFRRLINFTKENWPKISESLGNLFKTLGNITQGMEPIASKGLDALVKITAELAKVKPGTWTQIAKGFIAVAAGIKVLGVALAGIRILGMIRLFGALGRLGGGGGAAAGGNLASIGRGLSLFARGLGAVGSSIGVGAAIGKLLDKFGAIGPGGFFSQFDKKGAGVFSGMQMPKITQWIAKMGKQLQGIDLGGALKATFKVVPKLVTSGLTGIKSLPGILGGLTSKTIKIGFSIAGAGLNTAKTLLGALKNKTVKIIGIAAVSAWTRAKSLLASFKTRAVRLVGTAAVSAWTRARSLLTNIKPRTVRLIGSAVVGAWTRAKGLLNSIRNRAVRLTALAAVGAWTRAKSLLASIRNKTVRLLGTAVTGAWSRGKALLLSIKNRVVRLTATVAGMGAVSALKGLWNSITSKVVTITSFVKKVTGKAAGGPVKSRTPYLVGEVGPELFMPDSSGRIVPNNKLGQYAGAARGGDTYIVKVTGALDPVAVGREVQKALLALKRVNGGRGLGLA